MNTVAGLSDFIPFGDSSKKFVLHPTKIADT